MSKVLFLLVLLSTSTIAKDYSLAMTPSCPYYCPNDKKEGYIIEIMRLFFKENNHSLTINQTPYPRLKKSILKGNSHFGVMTALDLRNTSGLITYNTPLGHRSTGAISREADNLIVLDFNDLKNKKILIPKGSQATVNIIKAMNKINKSDYLINEVTGSHIHSRLIDLVSLNRGDVALDDYNVLKYNLNKSKHKVGITIAPTSLTGHNTISVVTRDDSQLRPLLSSKLSLFLKKIRKSGELAKILNKYDITDWERITSR